MNRKILTPLSTDVALLDGVGEGGIDKGAFMEPLTLENWEDLRSLVSGTALGVGESFVRKDCLLFFRAFLGGSLLAAPGCRNSFDCPLGSGGWVVKDLVLSGEVSVG